MFRCELPPRIMTQLRVLLLIGTRPEAIKLAPLAAVLRQNPALHTDVCLTGQHREMAADILHLFSLAPDFVLDTMQPGQTLLWSSSRILAGLETVLQTAQPDLIVVQGDTTTTLCGALAGFYARIPVAHVEAGLRTGNMEEPFPEEANRVLTGRLATLHFAATHAAAQHLLNEGVSSESIFITGNTGIDAVLQTVQRLEAEPLPDAVSIPPGKHLVVVTAHRRENFGAGLLRICDALRQLAERQDVRIVFPVHPNPAVREPVEKHLGGLPNIELIPPQSYLPFVDLLRRSTLLLTDSGGIQEEAPSLGKPVLCLREQTERPEAVEAGTVLLVGTDPERIVREATRLLDDAAERTRMSRIHNPYGNGTASQQIHAVISTFFKGFPEC